MAKSERHRRTREERAVLEILKPIALRIWQRVERRTVTPFSSNGRRRPPGR